VDLDRLLRPRSVAVVGASERPGSYGGEALLNLLRLGFPGRVYAVHPERDTVHGVECHPSLADLPESPDALAVAIPARDVAGVVEEAGRLGCGGAVVFAAGFAEGGGAVLERELAAAARRYGMPVCGPNGNGIVCLPDRMALWGDTVLPREPGPVALVSQSGNVAVNALASQRGLRLHTVVSCGNGTVVDSADFLRALSAQDGVRSVALYVEDDGDGERWCTAFESCARAGVAVAVLKAGASRAGAAAAEAHTGAVAGDQRAFRALAEEAGAVWARDPHELLELAKVLALPGSRGHGSRLAVMTCSGGDSAIAADLAQDLSVDLPALPPATQARLGEVLPEAAHAANPLDYTSLLWDEPAALRALVSGLAEDPAIDGVLVLFDDAFAGDSDGGDGAESWAAVFGALRQAALEAPVPVGLASTLPELMRDDVAAGLLRDGIPAMAGLSIAVRAMAALGAPPPDPARLAEMARAARRAAAGAGPAGEGGWIAEHEAKRELRAGGVPVPEGALVSDPDEAVAAWERLGGGPVALKLSGPALRHKSELGAVALDLASAGDVRVAFSRLRTLPAARGAEVLIERMAAPGVELLVAARRDGVVPTLVLALGGIFTELRADAAVVALPASAPRVARALRSLRGAALFDGARGRMAVDVDAVASLASRIGELLLDGDFDLVELNPVIAGADGAVAVDALARRAPASPVPAPLHDRGVAALEDAP
jgi:acetyl-CoA synthetase